MNPDELRYDLQTAIRYSDPPPILQFENRTLDLLDHYTLLLQLRNAAGEYHRTLTHRGIFQSIPTLTSETRYRRPGTYWRAVFKTNSPEVLAGHPRKHYIGSDQTTLDQWNEWIDRTRLAIRLNQLIHDIGMRLKTTAAVISAQADHAAAYTASYNLELEQLTP